VLVDRPAYGHRPIQKWGILEPERQFCIERALARYVYFLFLIMVRSVRWRGLCLPSAARQRNSDFFVR
jgi:hypothetical protein